VNELQRRFKANVLDGTYTTHANGAELLTLDLDEVLHDTAEPLKIMTEVCQQAVLQLDDLAKSLKKEFNDA